MSNRGSVGRERPGGIRANSPATAASYTRRSTRIQAEQSATTQVIHTLEGPVTAHPTDWIITGVNGEKYPIPNSTFQSIYQPVRGTPGTFQRTPEDVKAYQTTRTMQVQIPNGVLKASPGDWIITRANGESSVVKPGIFRKTYQAHRGR